MNLVSRKTRKRRPRTPRPEPTTAEKAKQAYRRSRKCLHHADFDGASQAIGEVLALDPAYPNAENFAGWILLERPMPTQVQLERALAHFHEALRLEPHAVAPTLNVGGTLVALGRGSEAIAWMESLVAGDRFKPEALNWLGWYWAFRKGDEERGLDLLQQATRAGPWKARAWVNLGTLEQQRGARSEACRAFRTALSCRDVADVSDLERRVVELEKEMQWLGEEPPIVIRLMNGELAGPELIAIEKACRDARYDDAIAALGNLQAYDLVDAIGIAYPGAKAAQAAGQFAVARRLMELAIRGYELYASSASSGAEGLGRMAAVEQMREELARWGG